MRYSLVGMGMLFSGCLLLWEAGGPLSAAQFMFILGRFDPRICAIMAPLAIGVVITASGVVMAVASIRRGATAAAAAWFILGDIVAPIAALGGHSIAVSLFGLPPI